MVKSSGSKNIPINRTGTGTGAATRLAAACSSTSHSNHNNSMSSTPNAATERLDEDLVSGSSTPNGTIMLATSSSSTPLSGRRRSSFLSPAMMHEVHNAFEVGTAEDGSPRYSLSLKESQGFLWNTDIFVSRHYRAMLDMEGFQDRAPEVREIHVDENDDIFPSDY